MKNLNNNLNNVEVVEEFTKVDVVKMPQNPVVSGDGKIVEATEVAEVTPVAENSTKKVSLRQDFLKGFSKISDNKEVICDVIGMTSEEFDKMKEYFDTQINKTNTVKGGDYKPTEKAKAILDILFSYDDKFLTGKEIAEKSNGLLKANGVSGSIRGLVTNGFVEATNDSPKKYKITDNGLAFIDNEEETETK